MRKPEARLPLHIVALTVTLAALLAWPAWTAMRHGLSDLYARPAIDYLAQKRFDANPVSEAEWQAIAHSVTQASAWMPSNPRYLESLGLLHQLKLSLFTDKLSIEEMSAHANAAEEYFSRAVQSRPTWPYYWGNLALEQYRRGNYASESYSRALANAARFGPWKNDTQQLVLDLGSETWEFLPPPAKREFVLNVERALHRQPENTVRIVRNYGAWPKICAAGSKLDNVSLPHLDTLCAQGRFVESISQLAN